MAKVNKLSKCPQVFLYPSDNVIQRYGDLLLGVFFLNDSTFSIQEGMNENAKVFHSGTARALETVFPIKGKYPLPLSGLNYDTGCKPFCFVTDQPDSTFFVYGICSDQDHAIVSNSTRWLDVERNVLYNNDRVKECSILQFSMGLNPVTG